VLELRQAEQSFHFEEVPEAPVPSLLRGFCAPVRLSYPYTEAQLAFLLAHDSDLFNRWEAGQSLATRALLRLVAERQAGREPVPDEALAAALGRVLEGADADPAMAAEILTLPGESYLADQMAVADVDAIHAARRFLRRALASHLRERLLSGYRALHEPGPYRFDSAAVGRRSLKNLCLGYLMELADEEIRGLCQRQYREAGNMTDRIAALGMLSGCDCPEREPALADFERTWAHDPLVLDKWFALQATSPLPGRLATVRRLMGHPGFDFKNPNRLRALVGSFCGGNPVQFHAATGEGYEFLTEQVLALYPLNPQVSARLLNPMTRWRRYHTGRQALMRAELERILAAPGLPKDVYEVVAKSLAG
jgi:aminopeptidase N